MIYATFRLQMTYRGKLMDDFCLKHIETCNKLYFIALQRFQTAKWPIRRKSLEMFQFQGEENEKGTIIYGFILLN